MKILLLGKTGLLGNAFLRVLGSAHKITAPSHQECDVTDASTVSKHIENAAPDLLINATGYTNVDGAEKERDAAFKINAEAIKNLCGLLSKKNIPLVHFSTDYVFDGSNKVGYDENAKPAPLSVYGGSKAAGETHILQGLKKYYLIRTSWLFGEGGKNFVDTVINLAQKNEPLKVVNDQKGNPTYTLDLAQAVLRLLKGAPYGIYHIVNDGNCMWHEFAVEIFHQIGIPKQIIPITSEELNRPARRPKYSMLKNTKLPKLRHWKKALTDYLTNKILIL